MATLLKAVLCVEHLVIQDAWFESDSGGQRALIVRVRPTKRQSARCVSCRRKCRGYDQGEGVRRWRGLDLGSMMVFLEADAPRVRCPVHGVRVAHLPWARSRSGFTVAFEDQSAWLVAHSAQSAVATLMRVSWRAVTRMVTRVVAEARHTRDRLAGLRRIGIDDKSYKKGHKYLMVVVDHDTGRVVWAKEGRDQATVAAFFADLGPERAAALTHVSCDGALWIHSVIKEKAPRALVCMDPFHVLQWASEAVDEVRRRVTRDAKAAGQQISSGPSRWALLKSPAALNGQQQAVLAYLRVTNSPLYRAYLIKEQLREAFRVKGEHGRVLLGGVISWAMRSRIPEMKKLAQTLKSYQDTIRNTMDSGVSNGRVEATNSHIQGLIKRAYGFDTAEALIAMIELTRGGLCPDLPNR